MATLTFGEIDMLERWRFYQFDANRLPSLAGGDVVFFIGYPGDYIRHGSRDRVLRYTRYNRTVTETSWTGFVLHSPPDKLHLIDRSGRETPAERITGISGAPVFRLNAKLGLDLIGFVRRVSSCGMSQSHEAISCLGNEKGYEKSDGDIYATYVRFIREDGFIAKPSGQL
ncbi:MAG: hypothetical protein HYY24_16180 [Verrucomicrobia bacterium]|nr:hypothetical protein [Verrucomicrobiota bacterium]